MKGILTSSATLGLAFSLVFSPPEDAQAQSASGLDLSQRANLALGLTHSLLGDVQVLGTAGEPVLVGVDLGSTAVLLDLSPHSVRAPYFEARAQQEDGSWVVLPPEPVLTYRGSVLDDPGSQVAASLLEDGVHALIRLSGGEELWLEPIAPRVSGASAGQHVLYSAEDVLPSGGTCDADLLPPVGNSGFGHAPAPTRAGRLTATSVTADLGCDTDFEYFQRWGSGTQARIESIVNTMNMQYVRDVEITHQISTLLIRSSSNDPYSKKVADQLLNELRNEWNSNQSGSPRDVVQLFTGRTLAGSTIGIAYVGTVCNTSIAYSLVQSDFNSNFSCATDLSAHELGHTWGASHCSCSTYTMNPSITCANRFHPTLTIPVITAYRNSQSCFGAPPATGSVAGTVTAAAGGAPIAGATVQVDSGQSATTAGNGSYSISGVPTGSRTVTASAPGYMPQSTGVSVNENQTATANFALQAAPVGSQAIVECITYSSTGGPNSDRNLFIEVLIQDDGGAPVAGASVSVSVDLNGSLFGTASASTGSDGTVTFQAKNSPNGCFVTDVTGVSAAGLSFDGTEPANGFEKGSDASPDPDCRGSSDPCGAG